MLSLFNRLKSVSPGELQGLIEQQKVMVFDVNSSESWKRQRVPGAIHLDPQAYGNEDLPPDKGSPLVFYCSNALCRKAPMAARRAQSMGYTDVRVMRAGISGWVAAKLPVESGAHQEPAPPGTVS